MYTDPYSLSYTGTKEKLFKQTFKSVQSKFIHIEASIEKRCNKFKIPYIPPNLSNYVEATLERKATLNKAITARRKRRQRASHITEEKEF